MSDSKNVHAFESSKVTVMGRVDGCYKSLGSGKGLQGVTHLWHTAEKLVVQSVYYSP